VTAVTVTVVFAIPQLTVTNTTARVSFIASLTDDLVNKLGITPRDRIQILQLTPTSSSSGVGVSVTIAFLPNALNSTLSPLPSDYARIFTDEWNKLRVSGVSGNSLLAAGSTTRAIDTTVQITQNNNVLLTKCADGSYASSCPPPATSSEWSPTSGLYIGLAIALIALAVVLLVLALLYANSRRDRTRSKQNPLAVMQRQQQQEGEFGVPMTPIEPRHA